MSLILCRQEPVTVPLYIEDLGIHLYSSQELCDLQQSAAGAGGIY